MATKYDGVYAVFAAGVAGTSMGVIKIDDGLLFGNDTSGSRYRGRVQESQIGGRCELDIAMQMPPGTFGIWGTSDTETTQTQNLKITLPDETFSKGQMQAIPNFELELTFKRIPDESEFLAGPNGIREMIAILEHAQNAWDNLDK